MFVRLFFSFTFCLIALSAFAQFGIIEGPATFCSSGTYIVPDTLYGFDDFYIYQITGSQNLSDNAQIQGTTMITYSGLPYGTYTDILLIVVTSYGMGGVSTTTIQEPLTFTVTPEQNLTINALGAFCIPDGNSTDACVQVCNNTLATYSVDASDSLNYEWTVSGAESFTPNGNEVTVQWGNAGQGTVTVIKIEENIPNLTATAGVSGISTPTSNISSFVNITSGTGPFIIEYSYIDGGVNSTFFDTIINDLGFYTFMTFASQEYMVRIIDANSQQVQQNVNSYFETDWGVYFQASEALLSCNLDSFATLTALTTIADNSQVVYQWSNGDTSPSIIVYASGTYTVTVTKITANTGGPIYTNLIATFPVTCSDNCPSTGTLCVNILQAVEASIVATPAPNASGTVELCAGQTLYLENNSAGAADYLWDFGDGNTSTQFSPSHVYANSGTYTVQLIARNACFCADTSTITINVVAAPKPEIDCAGTICQGETTTYTSTASCGSFQWLVSPQGTIVSGGGSADNFVEVQWMFGPEGTVSLQMVGCAGVACPTPNIINIPILSSSTFISGTAIICPGSSESYSIPNYQGTEFNWTVSNGGSIVSGQGSHQIVVEWAENIPASAQSVSVTYNNCYLDCGGSATLAISPQTKFYLTGPIEVCQSTIAIYNNVNTENLPVSSNWSLVNAAGTTVWSSASSSSTVNIDFNIAPGTYCVKAVPQNPNDYCIPSYTLFVKVQAPPPTPTGVNGPTSICPGRAYTYTATGNNGYGIKWSPQNGTVSVYNNNPANVEWGLNGTYSLALVNVSNDALECQSTTLILPITTLPNNFTLAGDQTICRDQIATYTAQDFEDGQYIWSVVPDKNGTIIEDNGSNEIQIMWHKAGPATVNVNLCNSSESLAVTVHDLPDPYVPDATACQNTTLSVPGGAYASFEWKDESSTTVSTAAIADLFPGYYELIVTDANGCSGDTTFYIAPIQGPNPTISTPDFFSFICPGDVAHLYSSTTEEGYTFEWFLNASSTGATADNYVANQIGSYYVEATNTYGCVGVSNSITLSACANCNSGLCGSGGGSGGVGGGGCNAVGYIDFNVLPVSDCGVHNYQIVTQNGVANSYTVSGFGDSFSGDNGSLSANVPGYGLVTLFGEIEDPNTGEICVVSQIKSDLFVAVANFYNSIICAGLPTQFTDASEYMPPNTITAWSWDFGDPASGANNTSSLQHPTHTYSTPGSYVAALTITMSSGCTTTSTQNIQVAGVPSGSISPPTTTCVGTPIAFSSANTDATSFYWTFGDPSSLDADRSELENSYHTYSATGNYTVGLTVRNIYGCEANYTQAITVTPNTLSGNLSAVPPSPLCEGDNSTITAPSGGSSWIWNTNSNTNSILVTQSGVYTVTITGADGCVYTPPAYTMDVLAPPTAIVRAVQYNEYDQPIGYIDNNITVCDGEDVFLQIFTNSTNSTISWSNGSTNEQLDFSADKGTLLPVGNYSFTATVTDQTSGCSFSSAAFNVTVNPKPTVAISSSPIGYLCENTSTTLSVSSPQASNTYFWNTGQNGNSITTSLGGNYFCRAISSNGCVAESNIIEIHNAPSLSAVPTGCLIRCQPDTMCLPNLPNVASYQWYFNGAVMPGPEGTAANPIFTQDGSYQVEMTDYFGCVSMSEPLNLDLYLGYGDINGTVYLDVNNNGLLDAADTPQNGIGILLNDGATQVGNLTSNASGNYLFNDVPAISYTLSLDLATLAAGPWEAIWTTANADLVGCDDTSKVVWLIQTVPCLDQTYNLQTSICSENTLAFNGQTLSIGQTGNATLLSFAGCDSIVNMTVLALPHTVNYLNETSCTGVPFVYQGTGIQPGSQAVFTNINTDGCLDSVVVSVAALPNSSNAITLNVCDGESIIYEGQTLIQGTTQTITLTNYLGCDSLVQVSVVAYPSFTLNLTSIGTCLNANDGQITCTVAGGTAPFTYAVDNQTPQALDTFFNLAVGTYQVTAIDANNCSQTETASIIETPSFSLGNADATLLCNQTIALTPIINGAYDAYTWSNGLINAPLNVTAPGTYQVSVSSVCDEIVQNINITNGEQNLVYMPNVFSPNGDATNDCFGPIVSPSLTVISVNFVVYNRWGNQVFASTALGACWNGQFDGIILAPDVFAYNISITAIDCFGQTFTFQQSSDVTLLQ